jgi:hypothetical protein
MIGPSGNVRVLVATRPVDFRKGADGLAALVRDTICPGPHYATMRQIAWERFPSLNEQRQIIWEA